MRKALGRIMWTAAGAVVFAAATGAHALVCRVAPTRNRVATFVGVETLGAAVLVAVLTRCYDGGVETLAGVLLYAFACELYIFAFTLVTSSVSVGLLLSLRQGPLTEIGAMAACRSDQMVARRLNDLVGVGLLVVDRNDYVPTRRAWVMLKTLRLLRSFFHGKRSGMQARPWLGIGTS